MSGKRGTKRKPAKPTKVKQRRQPAVLKPIAIIRSTRSTRAEAPRQGSEGAPDAWIEVGPSAARGLDGIAVGDDLIIITWLHRARRDVLKVHPRGDKRRSVVGVFTT